MAAPTSTTEVPRPTRRTEKILGAIFLVVLLGVVIVAVGMRQAFKGLARMDCGHNLVQVGLRCREYAAAHNGSFPSTWVQLNFIGEKANCAKVLRCPSTGHGVGEWAQVDLWADYRLVPGRTTNDPPGTVLAIEPLANHESTGGNVLFVDGSAQWWPASRIVGIRKEDK